MTPIPQSKLSLSRGARHLFGLTRLTGARSAATTSIGRSLQSIKNGAPGKWGRVTVSGDEPRRALGARRTRLRNRNANSTRLCRDGRLL
ncbi:hypothetical protein EVAR_95354_1 [Eumeta japonica]|uniref:Uncharacterized protein n=1 Tax=Eumeta variegata TaxID=151549 RepID=A0A4C1U939_EUMVA|nr:hypothetical protein EVAR_95354_1 [Eumeta japonica]